MTNATADMKFAVTGKVAVSGLLVTPPGAKSLIVFGHGAGAGMRHAFMERMTARLAVRSIATLRYQFPYMEAGKSRPDARELLVATVRAGVGEAAGLDLPMFAGGKSMGGRMTSLAASEAELPHVRGLVFFGFPLHPAGSPSTSRAEHLSAVSVPMLFLQGTRDDLADLELLRPICDQLGQRATLHVVDGADHSFHVLKRSWRTDDEVLDELADTAVAWTDALIR